MNILTRSIILLTRIVLFGYISMFLLIPTVFGACYIVDNIKRIVKKRRYKK